MHQIYLQMINQGYGINRKTVHRNYYSANELQAEIDSLVYNINIASEAKIQKEMETGKRKSKKLLFLTL